MKKFKMNKSVKIGISIFILLSVIVNINYKKNEKNDIFIPTLMYHNLDLKPEFKKITYTMKPKLFEKHMRALKNSGYNPITITELNEYFYNDKALPKKPILITLDDGRTNNYEYAYAILKDLHMKANMFVIVHTNEEHKNTNYLNWNRLKEMYDSSIFDIQSHTYNLHHKVEGKAAIFRQGTLENQEEYEKRILEDFIKSKKLIEEKIGNQVVSLAYPYGQYDETVENLAKQAGYKQTYTTDIGIMKKSSSPYKIKRVNVDGLCSEKRLLLEIKLLKILSWVF